MARWQQDAVDFACEAWAWQWVALFGRSPQKSSETLGRLASTLNLHRILTADMNSSGAFVEQAFPEVFMGQGLVVACAMRELLHDRAREVIFRHYVDRWYVLKPRLVPSDRVPVLEPFHLRRPIKQEIIAGRMGVSAARYYQLRDAAKKRLDPLVNSAAPPLSQKLMTSAG